MRLLSSSELPLAGDFRDAGGHPPSQGSSPPRVAWILGKVIYVCGKTTGKIGSMGWGKTKASLSVGLGTPKGMARSMLFPQNWWMNPKMHEQATLAQGVLFRQGSR